VPQESHRSIPGCRCFWALISMVGFHSWIVVGTGPTTGQPGQELTDGAFATQTTGVNLQAHISTTGEASLLAKHAATVATGCGPWRRWKNSGCLVVFPEPSVSWVMVPEPAQPAGLLRLQRVRMLMKAGSHWGYRHGGKKETENGFTWPLLEGKYLPSLGLLPAQAHRQGSKITIQMYPSIPLMRRKPFRDMPPKIFSL
jgi:hypothetical protein